MKAYEKPMILVDDNLTEGVYMASGDTTTGTGDTSSNVTASVSITGGNGSDTAYFTGTVKNDGSTDVTGWSATITFSGSVKSATVYNCIVSVNGSTITVTPGYDWNSTITANGSLTIGGSVTGDTVLSVM